jgi:hypothetical protein
VAGINNQLLGLPLTVLQPMQDEFIKCLTAIAVVGQSYSIGERNFTNANINEVRQTLMEVQAAIRQASGKRRTRVQADFQGRNWWRYGGGGAWGGWY